MHTKTYYDFEAKRNLGNIRFSRTSFVFEFVRITRIGVSIANSLVLNIIMNDI